MKSQHGPVHPVLRRDACLHPWTRRRRVVAADASSVMEISGPVRTASSSSSVGSASIPQDAGRRALHPFVADDLEGDSRRFDADWRARSSLLIDTGNGEPGEESTLIDVQFRTG